MIYYEGFSWLRMGPWGVTIHDGKHGWFIIKAMSLLPYLTEINPFSYLTI